MNHFDLFGKYTLDSTDTFARHEILLTRNHSVSGLSEYPRLYWRLNQGLLEFVQYNGAVSYWFKEEAGIWRGSSLISGGNLVLRKIEPFRSSVQPAEIIHFNPLHISANNHNPSIIRLADNRFLAAVRTGYYPDNSFIYLAILDSAFNVLNYRYVDACGIQDPKLFMHSGEILMLHNLHGESDLWLNRIEIRDGTPLIRAECQRILRLEYKSDSGPAMEKNWAPFVLEDKLYFLYRRSPHTIIAYNDETGKLSLDSNLISDVCFGHDTYKIIHGNGNPVRINNELYLATFHNLSLPVRNYTLGYYFFEAAPPFRVKRICREPLLKSSALIPELICDDPGQTARDEYGYRNGSNLLYLSTAVNDGGNVIFGLGINDVRSVFLRYSISDLLAASDEMTIFPAPEPGSGELKYLDYERSAGYVTDPLEPKRYGFLERGPESSCVRWFNSPDEYTVVCDKLYLRETRLLSFEIGDSCPLADLHAKCPVNSAGRHNIPPGSKRIAKEQIIEIARKSHLEFGFTGYVTFWGYNEPLLYLDETVEIISEIRQSVPNAKFLLLTGGSLLQPGSSMIDKLRSYDLVIINDYLKRSSNFYTELANHANILVNEDPSLDDRMLNYSGPAAEFAFEYGGCYKPNYELIIDHWGNLLMCCNDYKNETSIGNINSMAINDLLAKWKQIIFLPNNMGVNERHYELAPAICKRCIINTPKTRLSAIVRNDDPSELFKIGLVGTDKNTSGQDTYSGGYQSNFEERLFNEVKFSEVIANLRDKKA